MQKRPEIAELENLRAESAIAREREAATRQILHAISKNRDDDRPVFDVILQNAVKLCRASSARLHLMNKQGTDYWMVAAEGDQLHVFARGEKHSVDSPLVLATAMREARTIKVDDLRKGDLYKQRDPTRVKLVEQEGVLTFLAVPLIKDGRSIGCFGLHRKNVDPFTEGELQLMDTFAAQAVIAIENVRQFNELEALNKELDARVKAQVAEIERISRLKRFLPPAVVDSIVSSGSDELLSSHRTLLGVLFCDIRGFTAFCETAEPEETIEVLQTYHEEMGKLINAHGAGVDHRMGDGIMVLFNDPLPCDDPAGDAVRLAIAMRAKMAELSRHWKRLGYRLGFGVGVSLGYATVGMVGFEDRFDYTASGTAINLAARLCDEAEDGEILLSPRAALAIEDDLTVETKGELNLKGIREPVAVSRLSDAY